MSLIQKTIKKWLLGILIMFNMLQGIAQEYKHEFGVVNDNDAYLWYGQDRYYSNGLFFFYRRATDQQKLKPQQEKVIYEFSLGQKIFTPLSAYVPEAELQDRPFAGYLYGKAQANFYYKRESVWKIGLALGTLGPNSLSSRAQSLLHKTVGLYETSGWEHQIRNSLTADLHAEYSQLLLRNRQQSLDLALESYVNIGTSFNSTGVGFVVRTGHINQLFQTSYQNSSASHNSRTKKLAQRELYIYAKPQFNYIVYDATVQGSLFNSKSPVTFPIRPFVFEQKIGFNYSSPKFTIDYSISFRTKEIKSNASAHQYGSISLYYRFN
ncbi:lipid A deacylase LpxR family protein [Sphingobacterium sp. LRF_L2]|uniref:lipid A deacylase LpxR family protein n=1 Tax=Sphingobacterium sp. LRF_L2 TaxID=3369421 RepID=UPI003F5EE013